MTFAKLFLSFLLLVAALWMHTSIPSASAQHLNTPVNYVDTTVVARINAGGPEIMMDGDVWQADAFFSQGAVQTNVGIEIENTDRDEIYQTQRFDQGRAGITYSIPVPDEEVYIVHLHFAEIFYGAPGTGEELGGPDQRRFSVLLEDQQDAIVNLDIYDEVGPAAAFIARFDSVYVADGFLNLTFVSTIGESAIAAIEVFTIGPPPALAVSPITINYRSVEAGAPPRRRRISLTNRTSEPIPLSRIEIVGTDANAFRPGSDLPTSIPPLGTETVDVWFEPASPGTKMATLEIQSPAVPLRSVTLSGAAEETLQSGHVLYRVNAGGDAIEARSPAGIWTEDRTLTTPHAGGRSTPGSPSPYVNADEPGGHTYGTRGPIPLDGSVPPGTPPSIFLTERWSASPDSSMQWRFPVEAGTEVEIRLHLAEIVITDGNIDLAGPRIFDVSVDGFVPPVYENINLMTEVGPNVAVVKSYYTVSDGIIDLEFIQDGGLRTPSIQGIEILDRSRLVHQADRNASLIGLPVVFLDGGAAFRRTITAQNLPLTWNGADYVGENLPVSGKGYFLELVQFEFEGLEMPSLKIHLKQGWNLISGPSCAVAVADIEDPDAIITPESLHGFQGAYFPTHQLEPSHGYWIQATENGSITLNCTETASTEPAYRRTRPNPSFGVLQVEDLRTNKIHHVYFGGVLEEASEVQFYELPPAPPSGIFDVRFEEDTRLSETIDNMLIVQNVSTVAFTLLRLPQGWEQVEFFQFAGDDTIRSFDLQEGQSEVVDIRLRSQFSFALLTANENEVRSQDVALKIRGNYPNPFTTATTLLFDLPAPAYTTIEMYNVLGQLCLTVPEQLLNEGTQRIQIHNKNLPAGTYFYRVIAAIGSRTSSQTGSLTIVH